nr:reverse transcriptase domain-containing protein [Tanacetum cinerariifolium]
MDDEPMWAADRAIALKGNHLTLVKRNQFDGRTKTNHHKHIYEFLRIYDMFKYIVTENEVVRLMMFPLSLTREAKTWLDELNEETIDAWDELQTTFISLSFPPALFDRILREIRAISQHENESLTDAWLPENMLVEVGKFTFLGDFVILKIEEDSKVPLILGRPFLHTVDAVIRVKEKQLNLEVETERMIFNINSSIKHSYSNNDACFNIDIIDEILKEDFDDLLEKGSKILHSIEGTLLEEDSFFEFDEFMTLAAYENSESESDTEKPPFEKITINTDYKIKTSLEEPLMDLEIKPLPDNLEYVFLEQPYFMHVIISSKLFAQNKTN